MYQNGDLKIFNYTNEDKFELEMKFDFSLFRIKKFIYIDQISTMLLVDSNGKLFTLKYSTKSELINNLEAVEFVKNVITEIYSFKEYVIIIDENQNIFYTQILNLIAALESTSIEYKEKFKLIQFEKNYEKILKISVTEDNLTFIDSSYRVNIH